MNKIKVTIAPVRGDQREVEVDATHTSVRDALKAAHVSPNNALIAVDGNPADLDTKVAAGAKITLTEKARGS